MLRGRFAPCGTADCARAQVLSIQSNHAFGENMKLRPGKTTKPLWMLVILVMLAGCSLSPAQPPVPSLYFGVYAAGSKSDLASVASFEAAAGKKASIIMDYQGWGADDGSSEFNAERMTSIREHGSIPMITWEPWRFTEGPVQPAFSLEKIANGTFDEYITRYAQGVKAWGHPLLLRFAHEMNGSWYPWSELAPGNGEGQFIRAWRHVHDVFQANLVLNVSWVWSVNTEYPGSIPLAALYPGDFYVDWVGIDVYNWGNLRDNRWSKFSDIIGPTYSSVRSLTQQPMLITEIASTESGGDKAAWIRSTISEEIFRFPGIRGFVWFDENKETDWRISSSRSSRRAFKEAVSSDYYLANDFAALSTNPR